MKLKRHAKILDIIESEVIETQEDLIEKLNEAGYNVTQATVSRDIRELKLAKVMCETGKYKYIVPVSTNQDGQKMYNNALVGSIKSAESSRNLVVIKTYPGLAQAVAAAIDTMRDINILGCVAGDDTIIVVIKDDENAELIAGRIRLNIIR